MKLWIRKRQDHIPWGDQMKQNKERGGPDPKPDPHAGRGVACDVWKRLPDRNLGAMNPFPWMSRGSVYCRQSVFISGTAVRTARAELGWWSTWWGKPP